MFPKVMFHRPCWSWYSIPSQMSVDPLATLGFHHFLFHEWQHTAYVGKCSRPLQLNLQGRITGSNSGVPAPIFSHYRSENTPSGGELSGVVCTIVCTLDKTTRLECVFVGMQRSVHFSVARGADNSISALQIIWNEAVPMRLPSSHLLFRLICHSCMLPDGPSWRWVFFLCACQPLCEVQFFLDMSCLVSENLLCDCFIHVIAVFVQTCRTTSSNGYRQKRFIK